SNIVQEVDANEMWTYAKGYGDYGDGGGGEDWQNAKLTREYTSPIASIIGIRHAPPIKNGNITTKAQMDSQLKTLVDESLKISITADIHDLTRQNYPIAQSQLGDRVFVIDERIGLDEEVRIVNKSITRNWRGDILDVNLTFGSEGLAKRHQSNLNTALKNVTDWITGRKTIPYTIVDEAIKNATQALKNAQTELKFANGILAIDKQDPNKVVLFNSAGVGISSDGGNTFRTAMTGDGIVADVIYAGTLKSITVDSVEMYGSYIEGSKFVSKVDDNNYVEINGATVVSKGRHQRNWFDDSGINDMRLMFQNGQLRARNDTKNWSLYFNEWGITTFPDGSGEASDSDASVYIEFHSKRYHESNGLTIGSGARLGLETQGSRIYINPNGASVRISDVDDNFYGIAASNFNQSSRSNQKRDIKDLEDDALALINDLKIKEYKRLTGGEASINDRWQVGIIVEESPPQLLADGDSIDMYTYLNYVTKAVQQLYEEIEKLKEGA